MLLYPPRESPTTPKPTEKKRQRVALSFNGGKDCTVVLHLLLAALAESSASEEPGQDQGNCASAASPPASPPASPLASSPASSPASPPASNRLIDFVLPFYFATEDVFNEELDFVRRTSVQYFDGESNLLTLHDVTNQEGVSALVEQCGIKAFLMGTRSTDPDGRWLNGVFWPSSKGWTPFMRVNPCLDWSYQDVWIFLRFFDVDYCDLYNHGYTSIGSKSTTNRNPLLRKAPATHGGNGVAVELEEVEEVEEVEEEKVAYNPAYMLTDGSQERAGRVAKQKI
jgi:FAD synthetase